MRKKTKPFPFFPLLVLLLLGLVAALWYRSATRHDQSPDQATTGQASTWTKEFKTPLHLNIAEHGGLLVNSDGSAWIWGEKNSFAVGANAVPHPPSARHEAKQLRGIDRVVSASLTHGFAMAVRDDGSVWGIGNNSGGQLGLSIPSGSGWSQEWIKIPGLQNVVQVVATEAISLVLKKDGTVWASGINEWGRLGEDYPGPISMTHVKLPHLAGIVQIDASEFHETYYALRDDGRVLVWGNRYLLGLPYVKGAPGYLTTPHVIEDLDEVAELAGNRASRQFMVKRRDGAVLVWDGSGMETCSGETVTTFVIPEFQGAVSIAGGSVIMYAVKTDGSVWKLVAHPERIGCKPPEQLLPPGSTNAIKLSGVSMALLMRDGSVVVWGSTLGITNGRNPYSWVDWENRETIKGITGH